METIQNWVYGLPSAGYIAYPFRNGSLTLLSFAYPSKITSPQLYCSHQIFVRGTPDLSPQLYFARKILSCT